jgi:acyl-CoA thioesterase FadM
MFHVGERTTAGHEGDNVHEDAFTIVDDVVGPGTPGDDHHLVDYQTQELVSRLWSIYLAQVRADLAPSPVGPVMRRASYSLDNEAFAGQSLRRGIRAVSRTRRSCTFAAALWHPEDGRMVHSAEIVTVFVEPGKGSVEVPDDFWAGVEKLEGHTIPITERTR